MGVTLVGRWGRWGLGILGILLASDCADDTPAAPDPRVTALRLVRRIAAGNHVGAVEAFDAKMKRALPAERLRRTWATLVTGQGRLGRIAVAAAERQAGSAVVVVRAALERADLLVRVVVNARGRVAGLFFHPRHHARVQHRRDRGLRERGLLVGRGPAKLSATVTIPRGPGPFPALVLVPDGMPLDRDGTVGRSKPYRDLAWGLALGGVVVLRYESRAKRHPGPKRPAPAAQAELIDDTVAALARLRGLREVDPRRVFLLGHGLGGGLGPKMAGRGGRLAGVILIAPPARLRNGKGFRPAAAAAALPVPLLVLHGGRDRQLGRGDLATWKQALASNPRSSHRVFAGLDHWMIPRTPGKGSRPRSGKLAAGVIEAVGRWLKTVGTPQRAVDGGARAPAMR